MNVRALAVTFLIRNDIATSHRSPTTIAPKGMTGTDNAVATEALSFSFSLSLSLSFSPSLSFSFSFSISISLPFSFSLSISFSLSPYPSLSFSFLSVCPSLSITSSLSFISRVTILA